MFTIFSLKEMTTAKVIKGIGFLFEAFLSYRYYLKKRSQLENQNLKTKPEIEYYQFNELKRIIEYAYANVPYYTNLFKNINFHPDDFRTLEDIKKIPYLTKNIIRENQADLISRTFPRRHLKYVHTGGTTGLPLDFVLDRRTSSPYEIAFLEMLWKRIGYKRSDKCITLRQDEVKKIIEGKKYWRYDFISRRLIMSAFHLNADTFNMFYEKILTFKPKFIIAFPSNAFLLARFIRETNQRNIPSLKAVICSSENMYEWQRKYMEDVFKVPIYSYYGHSEKCILASECAVSTLYEFCPQYGFVELINKENNWCTLEDERGEIVATGFNNYASPFIRYKTDDIGIYTIRHCNDKSNWFTIKSIEGRKQDFLVDKDNVPKTSIHLDRPFWDIRDKIYAYQYVQNAPGKVLLKVHPKNQLSVEQIKRIKKTFFDTYFKFDLEIIQVDHIPRTKSGKFRYLIQNIKNI